MESVLSVMVFTLPSSRRDRSMLHRADQRAPPDGGFSHDLTLITAREYDVLRRVALGQSNPEIAEAMFLSRNTVKSSLQNACRKLGARNRVEAIAKARDLGLL